VLCIYFINVSLVHSSLERKILDFFVPELEKCVTESEEIAYEKKKHHSVVCLKKKKKAASL